MIEHTFSTREAASMLDLTPSEVRSFAKAGLSGVERSDRGEYRFGFRDLVVLRMAAALRRAKVPAGRIAGALADLRRGVGCELAELRLEALGAHVVVRDGEVVWRADSGQLQLGLESISAPAAAVDSTALPGPSARLAVGPEDDVDGWLGRAIARELGDPEGALAAYRRAVELDPGRWEAQTGLGFLLQELGRSSEAVDPYRRALEIEPDATVAFNLGVALDDLGRSVEAEGAYREALDLDPGLADAHFNLSCLFEKRGDRAAALRHMIAYREAVED